MDASIRISLPRDIATELLREGDAFRALPTRGGALGEIVNVTVQGVNVTASAVTVAVTGKQLYKVARKVLRNVRQGEQTPSTPTTDTPRSPSVRVDGGPGDGTLDPATLSDDEFVERFLALCGRPSDTP